MYIVSAFMANSQQPQHVINAYLDYLLRQGNFNVNPSFIVCFPPLLHFAGMQAAVRSDNL